MGVSPLLAVLLAAAAGEFPPADGRAVFLPPLPNGQVAVVSLTGRVYLATHRRIPGLDGFGSALRPEVLRELAGPDGEIDTLDVTLAAHGLGGSDLPPRPDLMDHPRVRHARARRENVRVYGIERGLVTVAEGLAGRTEISVEVFAGQASTSGRAGRTETAEAGSSAADGGIGVSGHEAGGHGDGTGVVSTGEAGGRGGAMGVMSSGEAGRRAGGGLGGGLEEVSDREAGGRSGGMGEVSSRDADGRGGGRIGEVSSGEAGRHGDGIGVASGGETGGRGGVWNGEVSSGEAGRRGGVGRGLIREAMGLVPAGEPVFAAVAPGNARSLRAFLAAGFVPLGSEVIILP